jgi:acetyl esterase/lipase
MKTAAVILFCLVLSMPVRAQEIIELPHENPSETVWVNPERQYFSEIWETAVVTNVSSPAMQVFRPRKDGANGTSVIVAPGGGFYALSIDSEGNDVAQWLVGKGITAFVLKYRLVPTGDDGVKEMNEAGDRFLETIEPIMPLAIADGLSAISYVRANAARFDLDPAKIGFMGFSAGGTVTMGVTRNFTVENRPDFIVPVYPALSRLLEYEVPENAPPMLVICASDDALGLASDSVDLYSAWHDAGVSAGLHMYSRGNHGFGMRKNGLPSDSWIERFYEWSVAEGITVPVAELLHEN